MSELLLEATGVRVDYALRRVLDIDRFELYDGERVGLVGENGVIHGLDHFGWSAPYKVLDEKFGYNGATVAAEVKKMLGK